MPTRFLFMNKDKEKKVEFASVMANTQKFYNGTPLLSQSGWKATISPLKSKHKSI